MLEHPSTSPPLRFVRCEAGNQRFALDTVWVRSIQRVDRLRPNPAELDARDQPMGWVEGPPGEIPVYRLATLLGLPAQSNGRHRRVLVLQPVAGTPAAGEPWALQVDRISQVIVALADRVTTLPPVLAQPGNRFFQGVVRLGETLILLLAPDRVHPQAGWPALDPELTPPGPPFAGPAGARPAGARARAGAVGAAARPGRGRMLLFTSRPPAPGSRPVVYGLSITQVPEVLVPGTIVPVPGAPPYVRGLINWRHHPVPLIDLDARLGLPGDRLPPVRGPQRVLLARDGNLLGGLLVRPSIDAIRLPVENRPSDQPPAPARARDLVRAVFELADATLIVPDIRAVLLGAGAAGVAPRPGAEATGE